jgi:hypothetical protein
LPGSHRYFYFRVSGPSSATRRGRTRALRIGPVTSQAAPYTAAAAARTPHAPQNLAHSALRAIEACQFGHSKGSFGGTAGCQAVDRQAESGQLVERTGEDRGSLSAGGGIGGCHGVNI